MQNVFCFSYETNTSETVCIARESYFRHLKGMFAKIKFFGMFRKSLLVQGRISGLNWPIIDISPYEFGEDGSGMARYECLIPLNLNSTILFYFSVSVF